MQDETQLIPRDDPRVLMAAERTLLAWIRTAVALMGFGFVVARFGLFLREIAAVSGHAPVRHAGVSAGVGTGLILLGAAVTALAAVQHTRFVTRYRAGTAPENAAFSLAALLSVVLTLAGVGLAVYLLVI